MASRHVIGVLGLAAFIIASQAWLVRDWRVDDAYISFAFSKNLARGNGLTFGYDLRVEGYTNFLWTAFNALPIALGAKRDPLIAARVGTFTCLAVLLWATYAMTRLFAGRVAAAAAVLVLSCWTDLTRAALSGLETVPHAMLIVLGTVSYCRELQAERRYSAYWFGWPR